LKEGVSIMPYREPATGERHELDLVSRLTGPFPMSHRHDRGSLKMFQKRVVERCCPAEWLL